ncbi:MAG: sensor histidine kinase [Leucobacter sp.]
MEQAAAAVPDAAGDSAAEEVRAQVRRLRRLLDDLDPIDDQSQGLHAAVRAVAENMPESSADVEVSGDDLFGVSDGARLLILRCTTELLRNALRHSRASQILVRFNRGEASLVIEVSDDGVGFDPDRASPAGHHGLNLVDTVVRGMGGSMRIRSGAHGTAVQLELPQDFLLDERSESGD